MAKTLGMLLAVILTMTGSRSDAMEIPTCDGLLNAIDFCTRYTTTAEQRTAMEKNRDKVSEMIRAGNPMATPYCKTDLPSWTDCSGLISFDWFLEGTDQQGTRHYYDRTNIMTDRFGAQVWIGLALAKPRKFDDSHAYSSFIMHMHILCENRSADWMDRHMWFAGSHFDGELFDTAKQEDVNSPVGSPQMLREVCPSP